MYTCWKSSSKFTKIDQSLQMDRVPVHIAAERGHSAIVDLLVDKCKASISARTKDGSTLMHIASQYGHPDTALTFLKKGVPLHMPNKVWVFQIVAVHYSLTFMIDFILIPCCSSRVPSAYTQRLCGVTPTWWELCCPKELQWTPKLRQVSIAMYCKTCTIWGHRLKGFITRK